MIYFIIGAIVGLAIGWFWRDSIAQSDQAISSNIILNMVNRQYERDLAFNRRNYYKDGKE